MRSHRIPRANKAVLALASVLTLTLTACGGDDQAAPADESLNYLVNNELVTTNMATAAGYTADAALIAERLYPSAYINGPKGQLIPNPDFIDAQLLPGEQRTAVYTISEDARFSDDRPVTCDSFVLAFAASRLDEFRTFLPLMSQVAEVRCEPGSKIAEVVFRDGFGDRWRQTFPAGSLMPVHVIADRLDVPLEAVTFALQDEASNPELVPAVADIWNTGFELDNFDPELQVSSGPYRIASVGDHGEVHLEPNEYFAGSPAETQKITIWPANADVQQLKEEQRIAIAEVPSMSDTDWAQRADSTSPYRLEPTAGILAEQLVLTNRGLFEDVAMRKAFAACVDQDAIAKVSSQESGVDVEPVSVRTVRLNDPFVPKLNELTAHYIPVDPEGAAPLQGHTVRVGYVSPNPRYAAMVAQLQESCGALGITVEDVSSPDANISGLRRTDAAGSGEQTAVDDSLEAPSFDAFIATIDPDQAFPEAAKVATEANVAREAELASWEKMNTIPLAAQPRIFVIDNAVGNVAVNSSKAGIGWNLDRWEYQPAEQ